MNIEIKIIIAMVFISFCSCENKQNDCSYIKHYYQEVYLAEEAFYKKDYQKVFDLMTKVTRKCELLDQVAIYETYKFAEAAARIGRNEKALELIERLILFEGYNIEELSKNEAFSHLLNTKKWNYLVENYDNLHQQYLSNLNLDLRKEIQKMIYQDQRYRIIINNSEVNQDSLWVLIREIDSINDIKLKDIINQYGYPNNKIVGKYNLDNTNSDPGILLFHFDDYDYYSKTLLEFIDNGKAPPSSLGNFVDSYQRRVDTLPKYIYGIYDNAGENSIIDYKNMDNRRISIGLPPKMIQENINKLKREYYNY